MITDTTDGPANKKDLVELAEKSGAFEPGRLSPEREERMVTLTLPKWEEELIKKFLLTGFSVEEDDTNG